MFNFNGLDMGSFVARRELIALLGDMGCKVLDLIQIGHSVYVEVKRDARKTLLEFELGNLEEDNSKAFSDHSYRELFKPTANTLKAQVLKFVKFD